MLNDGFNDGRRNKTVRYNLSIRNALRMQKSFMFQEKNTRELIREY